MLILVLCLILFAPVNITFSALHDGPTDFTLHIRIWGLGGKLRFRSTRDKLGHHLVRLRNKQSASAPESDQRFMVVAGTLLRADKARRFLLRHVHVLHLALQLSPSLWDASATAMATGVAAGAAQIASRLLRCPLHCRIQPDFIAPRSRFFLRCIIFLHLGTLIITAGMVLLALLLERLEHRSPKPKEANEYGSSHW